MPTLLQDLRYAVQRAVADADPDIPVAKLATMRTVMDRSIAAPRFFSLALGTAVSLAVPRLVGSVLADVVYTGGNPIGAQLSNSGAARGLHRSYAGAAHGVIRFWRRPNT